MIVRSVGERNVAAGGFREQWRDICWNPTLNPGSRWAGCPDLVDPEGCACRPTSAFHPWSKDLFVAILRACCPSR